MVHALKYYCGEGVLPAVQEAGCPGISEINEIVFMLLLSYLMDVIKIKAQYIILVLWLITCPAWGWEDCGWKPGRRMYVANFEP